MENLNFPLFITWSITSNCNLRCKHCFRNEYNCDLLSRKAIDRLTDLFILKQVNRIILTGGEPLKSKNLLYIVERLHNKIKVGIATNGTLLTDEIIKELKGFGVKDYQISLDGATEPFNDYIRGKGVYKRVIESIKLLQENNCNVTLAMTVNSFNYYDILNNSILLVKQLGVKKLRIEYYIPVNPCDNIKKVSLEDMQKFENQLLKYKNDIDIQLPSINEKNGCGAGIYNCVLNSDLSISPCDLLTHKYRTKEMTNIDEFVNLWLHDDMFTTWRKKTKCLACKNRYKCLALEEENEE